MDPFKTAPNINEAHAFGQSHHCFRPKARPFPLPPPRLSPPPIVTTRSAIRRRDAAAEGADDVVHHLLDPEAAVLKIQSAESNDQRMKARRRRKMRRRPIRHITEAKAQRQVGASQAIAALALTAKGALLLHCQQLGPLDTQQSAAASFTSGYRVTFIVDLNTEYVFT